MGGSLQDIGRRGDLSLKNRGRGVSLIPVSFPIFVISPFLSSDRVETMRAGGFRCDTRRLWLRHISGVSIASKKPPAVRCLFTLQYQVTTTHRATRYCVTPHLQILWINATESQRSFNLTPLDLLKAPGCHDPEGRKR